MRHTLREESYVSRNADGARLLTGFVCRKLIRMNAFYMIPQFVGLAQCLGTCSVQQTLIPEAKRTLEWVALFGDHFFFGRLQLKVLFRYRRQPASSLVLLSILQFDPDFNAGILPCKLFIEAQFLHRSVYQLNDLISFRNLMGGACSRNVLRRCIGRIVAKLFVEFVRIGISKMSILFFRVEFGSYVGLMAIQSRNYFYFLFVEFSAFGI